jgi:hypothetical protein
MPNQTPSVKPNIGKTANPMKLDLDRAHPHTYVD